MDKTTVAALDDYWTVGERMYSMVPD